MAEEKPFEEMDEDDIESLMIEGIHKGDMEFAGMKDGDIAVSVTE